MPVTNCHNRYKRLSFQPVRPRLVARSFDFSDTFFNELFQIVSCSGNAESEIPGDLRSLTLRIVRQILDDADFHAIAYRLFLIAFFYRRFFIAGLRGGNRKKQDRPIRIHQFDVARMGPSLC